jgi:hypothetical protein
MRNDQRRLVLPTKDVQTRLCRDRGKDITGRKAGL